MAFAALYDANVLIPHEIRDILMISATTRQYAVFWSEDILAEWRKNHVGQTEDQWERIVGIMSELFPAACIARSRYERIIQSMTNHKGDRHVLAAAVVANADVIVTSNVSHFKPAALELFNMEAQLPDVFVRTQAALNPLRFRQTFLRRAEERNRISIRRGRGTLSPEDIAMYLRDGPSKMPETGQYLLELLAQNN